VNARRFYRFFAASLLFAAALLPATARAQGMYYKEIEKDGRVYVFNLAAEADRFEKSGEVGRAITKPAYGPDGVTVVFDSEQAIELYNFKHGIAVLVEKPKTPKVDVTYRDGRTTVDFDNAQVQFQNRLQLRYTHQLPPSATQLPGTGDKGDSKGSFRIRRYEPQFQGWIYKKWIGFKLEFAFQDLQNDVVAGGAINDAYFTYDFGKGSRSFRVQFGQFKVPFGRQEMTSSFNQEFVDRSIVAGEYERGRDQGVQLDGLLGGGKLEWRVGLFNGNQRNKTLNDNNKFQYDARVTWMPWGDPGYSEVDFESTDKPLFALAGQWELNDFANTVAPVVPTGAPAGTPAAIPSITSCPCGSGPLKRTAYGVDAVLKYQRLFLMGAFYNRKIDPIVSTIANFKSNGYHAQAGYLLDSARHWEVALRYATFDPTDQASSNDRNELGFGLNYFYNKHNAKIQSDYRILENKSTKLKDKELRVQTQLNF
jgi:phosphate-selective porin OprO/OprP